MDSVACMFPFFGPCRRRAVTAFSPAPCLTFPVRVSLLSMSLSPLPRPLSVLRMDTITPSRLLALHLARRGALKAYHSRASWAFLLRLLVCAGCRRCGDVGGLALALSGPARVAPSLLSPAATLVNDLSLCGHLFLPKPIDLERSFPCRLSPTQTALNAPFLRAIVLSIYSLHEDKRGLAP